MTIQINYEAERKLDIDYEKLASEVAEHILETENCPYDVCVNLVITDNEEIKRVNTEFRSIGAPTDVLSFPMLEYETPGDFSHFESEEDCFDPETGELLLGDIVISKEKVIAQAEEYGHSVKGNCFISLFTAFSISWATIIWKKRNVLKWRLFSVKF